MHAEHADSVTRSFARQVLRELDDRRLRHGVTRHHRPPEHSGLAGEVDDTATAAGDHVGQDELRADEDAAHVDFHRAPPGVELDLPHRADRPDDSGVVDEQVDRSEFAPQLGDGARKGTLVADVGGRGGRDATDVFDEGHGGRELVAGPGDESDRRAGRGQSLRDEAADAAPAAGHQRDRACELRRGTECHRPRVELAGTGGIGGFM